MNEKLKPCPFCGKDVDLSYSNDFWQIKCISSHCDYIALSPKIEGGIDTDDEAFAALAKIKRQLIEAWNKRYEKNN